MSLPITILGGYLGAGKTTLVNHLLRHADGLRLAVLVNEFGALPIDADLIEAQDEDIISIAGGCVCCSYGNDLTLALMDMVRLDPPPDHVILEASGVALPGAIAASVSLLQGYAMDGIVVLCDAETIQERAGDTYVGDTIERQLDAADLVVLNKVDLCPAADLRDTAQWLREQAPNAEIVMAEQGAVPPETVLKSFLGRDRSDTARAAHQPTIFKTISLSVDRPVDASRLAEDLASAALGLVRAKGFVENADGDLMAIQVVGRRWTVTPSLSGAARALVVVGSKSGLDEEFIRDVIQRAM